MYFYLYILDVLVDTSLITADGDHETSDVDLSSGGNSPNYDPLSPTGTGVEIKLGNYHRH